jgi:uncharacterized protein
MGYGVSCHRHSSVHARGHFNDDMLECMWKVYYSNGVLKQRGAYKKGKAHGMWNFFFENGDN